MLFSIERTGLKLHQSMDTAAILDQKWSPHLINGLSILAVVNAQGSIEVYKFENKYLTIYGKYSFSDNECETLVLSLDWSTGKYESLETQVVCSDSKGNIHLLSLGFNGELVLVKTFHSHDFEAWIAGFYYWDTNIIFSGGDDSLFLQHDLRCKTPAAKNRSHEAGVTSFHSNKTREFVVASGSYDTHIRIWDIRNFKKCSSTTKMPGPLWRLKWDPFLQRHLLAACMQGGVHYINAGSNGEIVDSYYEHKDISYGADWCFLDAKEIKAIDSDSNGNVIIGSCSFYDHLLCVSKTLCDFEI